VVAFTVKTEVPEGPAQPDRPNAGGLHRRNDMAHGEVEVDCATFAILRGSYDLSSVIVRANERGGTKLTYTNHRAVEVVKR
jgi:hypothetical protein